MNLHRIQRTAAILLTLSGLSVAVNLVAEPFYESGPVWVVQNWFTAVGCVAIFAISILKKLHRIVVYGAMVLLTLFLWKWFSTMLDVEADFSWVWIALLYPVMSLEVARSLWFNDSDQPADTS